MTSSSDALADLSRRWHEKPALSPDAARLRDELDAILETPPAQDIPEYHRMSPATGGPACSMWRGVNPYVTGDARKVTCLACQLIQGCWD